MVNPKLYKELVYNIIGAAMKVHRELNWGVLEALYTEALHIELDELGIANIMEAKVPCYYKGMLMEKFYQPDLMVGDVMIELKSVQELVSAHRAQLFNYMRITHTPIGLLINFGRPSLEGERYMLIEDTNECVLLDKNMDPVYDYPYNDYYEMSEL